MSGDGRGDGAYANSVAWTQDFRVTRIVMEFKSGTIFMIMRLGLMLIPMCVPRLFFFFWPPVDIVSAFYTLFVVTWARGLAQQPESMPKTKSLTFFIIRDVHEKKKTSLSRVNNSRRPKQNAGGGAIQGGWVPGGGGFRGGDWIAEQCHRNGNQEERCRAESVTVTESKSLQWVWKAGFNRVGDHNIIL